jgi:hypothetical protein
MKIQVMVYPELDHDRVGLSRGKLAAITLHAAAFLSWRRNPNVFK